MPRLKTGRYRQRLQMCNKAGHLEIELQFMMGVVEIQNVRSSGRENLDVWYRTGWHWRPYPRTTTPVRKVVEMRRQHNDIVSSGPTCSKEPNSRGIS